MSPGNSELRWLADVPRETSDAIEAYRSLIRLWRNRINICGPEEAGARWTRHLAIAHAIARELPPRDVSIVDVGSGGGLLAIPLSLLSGHPVIALESDKRKVAFLCEAVRVSAARVHVIPSRAEKWNGPPADILIAQAFAPLDRLLHISRSLISPTTTAMFPKGEGVEAELRLASFGWTFSVERLPEVGDQPLIKLTHMFER